jgi:hypothetical protein
MNRRWNRRNGRVVPNQFAIKFGPPQDSVDVGCLLRVIRAALTVLLQTRDHHAGQQHGQRLRRGRLGDQAVHGVNVKSADLGRELVNRGAEVKARLMSACRPIAEQ